MISLLLAHSVSEFNFGGARSLTPSALRACSKVKKRFFCLTRHNSCHIVVAQQITGFQGIHVGSVR